VCERRKSFTVVVVYLVLLAACCGCLVPVHCPLSAVCYSPIHLSACLLVLLWMAGWGCGWELHRFRLA
jgi:hypothetical protein